MFNATPEEQQVCARDIIRWIEDGVLKPLVGRTFPLAAAIEAEKFLEANTVGGAGSLTGKIVINVD
jgi:NADPH2:quinone reductase